MGEGEGEDNEERTRSCSATDEFLYLCTTEGPPLTYFAYSLRYSDRQKGSNSEQEQHGKQENTGRS